MTSFLRTAAALMACITVPSAETGGQSADSLAPVPAVARLATPFSVGEKLSYEVHFGFIRVGSASMDVLDVVPIRDRDTWHTRLRVKGGITFARVDDLYESWIDTATFSSLRFAQDLSEVRYQRRRHFEIYPERRVFTEDAKAEEPTVESPLDDGSFLYFIRTVPLEVGKTYEFHRYFRPDRNPVVVKVLRKESIKVPAGRYNTIVLQPIIKTSSLFADGGHAQIWLSDDSARIMVQLKTKLNFGSLNLYLTSHTPGATRTPIR